MNFLKNKNSLTKDEIGIENKDYNQLSERKNKVTSLSKLRNILRKTRVKVTNNLKKLLFGKNVTNEQLLEHLENTLLMSDMGHTITKEIIKKVKNEIDCTESQTNINIKNIIKTELKNILQKSEREWLIETGKKPFIILIIGANGVGKTTTIGKLTRIFELENKSVVLAAGDTFRAAATEQIKIWGELNNVPVITPQKNKTDGASVIFDAIQFAKSNNKNIVIADTAGRLQNKKNLVEELKKIYRVIKKTDVLAPHEVMLILDSNTGRNSLTQAIEFNNIIPISSVVITKMDYTSKGGAIFSIAQTLNLPIRFITTGEDILDIKTFKAHDFVEAMFENDDEKFSSAIK